MGRGKKNIENPLLKINVVREEPKKNSEKKAIKKKYCEGD